jgi:hypothetical protein
MASIDTAWVLFRFDRSAVTFAYVTGSRINSEVLPLPWRQVDRAAAWSASS